MGESKLQSSFEVILQSIAKWFQEPEANWKQRLLPHSAELHRTGDTFQTIKPEA